MDGRIDAHPPAFPAEPADQAAFHGLDGKVRGKTKIPAPFRQIVVNRKMFVEAQQGLLFQVLDRKSVV